MTEQSYNTKKMTRGCAEKSQEQYFRTPKQELMSFILRFEIITFAVSTTAVISVFEVITAYQETTLIIATLISLIISTYGLRRYGYLLDVFRKKRILTVMTSIMLVIVGLAATFDIPWMYCISFVACNVFFSIFFSLYNSMAQMLPMKKRGVVSSSIEVVSKIVTLMSSAYIWCTFNYLGTSFILTTSFILLLIALSRISQLCEYKTHCGGKTKQGVGNKSLGFTWLLKHPIIVFVVLTMTCNIIVLQSNTINAVYMYNVLQKTPETLSLITVAFSAGSLVSAVASFLVTNEKVAIGINFITSGIMAILLAFYPTVEMFSVAMFVFGASNSMSRVMLRNLIMKNVSDSHSATFYALQTGLVSGTQLVFLSMMTLTLSQCPPALVIWFFPAIVMTVPLWLVLQASSRTNKLVT